MNSENSYAILCIRAPYTMLSEQECEQNRNNEDVVISDLIFQENYRDSILSGFWDWGGARKTDRFV